MSVHRRFLLGAVAGACVGSTAGVAQAGALAQSSKRAERSAQTVLNAADVGVLPDLAYDQTTAFQKAIDLAAKLQVPLQLQSGRYICSGLRLHPRSWLQGVGQSTVVVLKGQGAAITAADCPGIVLQHFSLRGELHRDATTNPHLVGLSGCSDLLVQHIDLTDHPGNALDLRRCSGRITSCRISSVGHAAIKSVDATGLSIDQNDINQCHNNGILVWREKSGEDGTLVVHNRVSRIAALAGGSGQNGNGINVFRADGVLVEANRITDCAYSAVRGNSASNLQIVANNVARIGEVALYAEFAFQGAVIANNIVEQAATGVSVTNFNDGGRLAVVQGNVIRSLFRREDEPVDKRGVGIAVEADTSVTGNTIEGAPTAGMTIGWHQWMRNVAVTGNVVRECGLGIGLTGHDSAGAGLVSNNVIDRCPAGAIRRTKGNQVYGQDLANASPDDIAKRLMTNGNIVS